MIIDTHAHLNDKAFIEDIEKIIQNAIENDVLSMCIIGWDKESSLKAIEICEKYSTDTFRLFPVAGLHPSNVQDEKDLELTWLIDLIKNKKIIAIGEIGMDLYWDKTYLDLEVKMFQKQMELALKYDLPVIIHNRDAMQMTFDIIKEYQGVKGILHCYSGSIEMAKEIIKLGYKLGIGGVLTYKNSHLNEVIDTYELKNFVSETDSPYLPPVPYRGKRNEPCYIVEVIKKIASIKNTDIEEVKEVLYNNAKEVLRF